MPAAPDTTPPSAPTGSTAATAVGSTQINLSWTAATDNVAVTGYRVERCQGAGCTDFAEIATPTATTYSDTGLAPSTDYRYRVRATDAAGNLGSYSTIATATTPSAADTTPAVGPSRARGHRRQQHPDRPHLDRLDRQRRRHRLSGRALPGRELHRLRPDRDPTAHRVQQHRPGARPRLPLSRARHRRGGQPGPYSTIATATTPAAADTTPPSAPAGLSATAVSTTQIDLDWAASTDNVGVTGYRVERCQGDGCTNFAQVGTPTTTSYSNTGLQATPPTAYRVRAIDAAGNLSAYSAIVTDRPWPPTPLARRLRRGSPRRP